MKPRIPKGWIKLKAGTPVRLGDRSWEGTAWATLELPVELRDPVKPGEIIIRRKGGR